jgi:membrane associated rhomboid family serine protease
MGIYDRDYARVPRGRPGGIGAIAGWSMNTWIIVLTILAFLLQQVTMTITLETGQLVRYRPAEAWGYFSLSTAIYSAQLWRFLTFQFLHGNLNHILFNMLGLFFFGRLVESYLGSRRYVVFYLLCGVGGPVAYVLLYYLNVLGYPPQTPLVGASAGVFGVLVACAVIAPQARVQLLFPPIELTMRQMAMIYIGIAAFIVLSMGRDGAGNAGGEAAHLGGALVGYLLIRSPHQLAFADRLAWPRRKPRMRYRP